MKKNVNFYVIHEPKYYHILMPQLYCVFFGIAIGSHSSEYETLFAQMHQSSHRKCLRTSTLMLPVG